MTVKEFIENSWDECVRFVPKDEDTLIGMPYPYIVPCKNASLQEMYYWDTFFTCKGLYLSGRAELAKNCTDDMLYMVERFGFMPNGNRTYYLSHSQPPFLSMMVRDVYAHYGNKEWLQGAYETLKKEYDFWMNERMTPIGLNTFKANEANIGDADKHYESICRRIAYQVPMEDHKRFAMSFLADCESGWDFNPRTNMKQLESVYVDLNSNLYLYETNFAYFAELLDNGEKEYWEQAAFQRKRLMNQYLWNGTAFVDYNYVAEIHSEVFSAASFYPLWAGVADAEQAKLTIARLEEIETEYGLSACGTYNIPGKYQWGYGTGWAPLHYLVINALDRYGYKADAVRIAEKYMQLVQRAYDKTGELWEKFHVLNGSHITEADYNSREMIGWTAGVYLYAEEYIKN